MSLHLILKRKYYIKLHPVNVIIKTNPKVMEVKEGIFENTNFTSQMWTKIGDIINKYNMIIK